VGIRSVVAGRSAYRKARAHEIEPWLGRHEDRGDFELVVLPTEKLLAVSVPAAPPQVLISNGLVERLDADQLEAVIRHEATHHRFGHWRFTLLAAITERGLAPLPLVGRSARALRAGLEEWADEAAAGGSLSGRAVVRDAIIAVAVAVDEARPRYESSRDLRERTRRLECDPDVRSTAVRVAMHAPVLMLGVASMALLAGWTVDAHQVAALAGYCPD
jgi:beta-lactamase regulating signal transducer with metallopeptidase domain